MNYHGQEFARLATDSQGCVVFQLLAAGAYRFDVVNDSSCDGWEGTTVADWNGTALLQLEMSLTSAVVNCL